MPKQFIIFLIVHLLTFTANKGYSQFHGKSVKKIEVERLLILNPFGAYTTVGDDHIPVKNPLKCENVTAIVNNCIDSIMNIKMTTTRFPSNVELDSVVGREIKMLVKSIGRNKTVKGGKVPPIVLKIMEKTNSDYAVAITYEIWNRSKKNLNRVKGKENTYLNVAGAIVLGAVVPVGAKINTPKPSYEKSFISMIVMERKSNTIQAYCYKELKKNTKNISGKTGELYRTCFSNSTISSATE